LFKELKIRTSPLALDSLIFQSEIIFYEQVREPHTANPVSYSTNEEVVKAFYMLTGTTTIIALCEHTLLTEKITVDAEWRSYRNHKLAGGGPTTGYWSLDAVKCEVTVGKPISHFLSCIPRRLLPVQPSLKNPAQLFTGLDYLSVSLRIYLCQHHSLSVQQKGRDF
jgi:hypothetical protein